MSDKSPDLSMEVEFTQTLTILPPDSIQDEVEAEAWLDNDTKMILRDGIDIDHGEVKIKSIDGRSALNFKAVGEN